METWRCQTFEREKWVSGWEGPNDTEVWKCPCLSTLCTVSTKTGTKENHCVSRNRGKVMENVEISDLAQHHSAWRWDKRTSKTSLITSSSELGRIANFAALQVHVWSWWLGSPTYTCMIMPYVHMCDHNVFAALSVHVWSWWLCSPTFTCMIMMSLLPYMYNYVLFAQITDTDKPFDGILVFTAKLWRHQTSLPSLCTLIHCLNVQISQMCIFPLFTSVSVPMLYAQHMWCCQTSISYA